MGQCLAGGSRAVDGDDDVTASLVDVLRTGMPDLRGHLEGDVLLAPMTWFRVGGPAEVLFSPRDEDDLACFLRHLPLDVPLTVIGLGSNLLVRDGGIRGVVIRLGRGFAAIDVQEESRIRAGAGVADAKLARVAARDGIAGLAFLCGIPGSIGGALRMNGGAYGREMKDVLIASRAVTRSGGTLVLSNEQMGFSYRHTCLPEDVIFVEATLQGYPGACEEIMRQMREISDTRGETQPVRMRSGGSTFRNPPGEKAWELIDAAGCRGLKIGGAQVSELHCNFLVNTGNATAYDIETLGECVRERVKRTSGVDLVWEIRRVGQESGQMSTSGVQA